MLDLLTCLTLSSHGLWILTSCKSRKSREEGGGVEGKEHTCVGIHVLGGQRVLAVYSFYRWLCAFRYNVYCLYQRLFVFSDK